MLLSVLLSLLGTFGVHSSGLWCSKCICTSFYQDGAPYLNVLCDSNIHNQKTIELEDSDETGKVKDLRVQNYLTVKLDISHIGTQLKLKRGIFVFNVHSLTLMQWAEGCNHTLVNITSLSLSREFSRRPSVDSVTLVNTNVPEVPRGGMAFASLNHKFVVKGVTFGDIRHKGIILPIGEKKSMFLFDTSRVTGHVDHLGVSVRAAKILVTHSVFSVGAASGFRLFATEKAVISDSTLEQISRGKDFFDLYSPVILLLRNRFIDGGEKNITHPFQNSQNKKSDRL